MSRRIQSKLDPDPPAPLPPLEECADRLEHELDVLRAIRAISFGTIEVVVHQSRIVQITRSEKLRFEPR